MGLSVPFRFLSKPPRPPAGCVALVREALLPVQVWLDVPVERDVAVGLTGVERFFLEAALALRRFVAADIEEITSLPRLVVHRLAARMMSQRALTRADGAAGEEPAYLAAPAAEAILSRETVIERRAGKLSFLWLPRTDDLVVFDAGGENRGRTLDRLRPVGQFPIPPEMRAEGRSALLARRIAERSAARLPADVVSATAVAKDREIPSECPVYRCHGAVIGEGPAAVVGAVLFGEDRKRRRPPDVNGEAAAAAAPNLEVRLDLSGAEGLRRMWVEPAGLADDPDFGRVLWEALRYRPEEREAMREGPADAAPPLNRLGPLEWAFTLSADEATALVRGTDADGRAAAPPGPFMEGRNLLDPFGLEIETEEAVVEAALGLEPADEEAAAVFALDEVVREVLNARPHCTRAGLHALIRKVATLRLPGPAPNLTAAAVLERLWELRHYPAIYALRVDEDFCYD